MRHAKSTWRFFSSFFLFFPHRFNFYAMQYLFFSPRLLPRLESPCLFWPSSDKWRNSLWSDKLGPQSTSKPSETCQCQTDNKTIKIDWTAFLLTFSDSHSWCYFLSSLEPVQYVRAQRYSCPYALEDKDTYFESVIAKKLKQNTSQTVWSLQFA